jgi:hypothetical protein
VGKSAIGFLGWRVIEERRIAYEVGLIAEATCNNRWVRQALKDGVHERGIENPVFGEAQIHGKTCEVLVSTYTGKKLGYIHYRTIAGRTGAPTLQVFPLAEWLDP